MPRPTPTEITFREWTGSDIVGVAELFLVAPDDGTLYQFPEAKKHHQEMLSKFIRYLKSELFNRKTLTRIADLRTESGEKIVGFSQWHQRVKDPKGSDTYMPIEVFRPLSLQDLINWPLMALEATYKQLYSWLHQEANLGLQRNPKKSEAIRAGRNRSPQLEKSIPCFQLSGLAVHPDHQGFGIATKLVRWGMDQAKAKGVPVITGGEESGLKFYQNALGFKRIRESEYWIDPEGNNIDREEVEKGNDLWKKVNGGVSGSDAIWCPDGIEVDLKGLTPGS
ncbi:hypothetical protein BT63DRAFT_424032 [Microthyrium microscopicum]|uniref:N-acetyltransferase domain-containing protein n=1 Tax=Microthyrium microscopicum TaxID=703497 RepID=A0A6A6UD38_9PEZI|nr:hypothetical protein BT63DRAFT_424032 [Microthyrium microscopicum]